MPIVGIAGREGPGKTLARQPLGQMRIFYNVRMVVEVDESVSDRPAEHDQHRQQQKTANGQRDDRLPAEAAKERF